MKKDRWNVIRRYKLDNGLRCELRYTDEPKYHNGRGAAVIEGYPVSSWNNANFDRRREFSVRQGTSFFIDYKGRDGLLLFRRRVKQAVLEERKMIREWSGYLRRSERAFKRAERLLGK